MRQEYPKGISLSSLGHAFDFNLCSGTAVSESVRRTIDKSAFVIERREDYGNSQHERDEVG